MLYVTLRFSAKGTTLRLQMNVDGLPLLKSLNIQRKLFLDFYFGGPRKPESSFWIHGRLWSGTRGSILQEEFWFVMIGVHHLGTQRHSSESFHEAHNSTQWTCRLCLVHNRIGRHVEGLNDCYLAGCTLHWVLWAAAGGGISSWRSLGFWRCWNMHGLVFPLDASCGSGFSSFGKRAALVFRLPRIVICTDGAQRIRLSLWGNLWSLV